MTLVTEGAIVLAELGGGAVGFLANSLGAAGLARIQWCTVTGAAGTCLADNRGRLVVARGAGRPTVGLLVREPGDTRRCCERFETP